MAQSPSSAWTFASEQRAEAQITKLIDETRKAAGLPPLKHVKASVCEIELVCTAALTGNNVHDPLLGNLHTYLTGDLTAVTEYMKLIALGTSEPPDGGPRWRVDSDEKWPRFSVVVLLDGTGKVDLPTYRVGVARRPSIFRESMAPLTGDNPADGNDWKKQVAPACVAHSRRVPGK